MKIIQDGELTFKDTTLRGECRVCGCIFEIEVQMAKGKNGSIFTEIPRDLIGVCSYHGNNVVCDCPSCGKSFAVMKEK